MVNIHQLHIINIADVCLPLPEAEVDARNYNDEKGEVGGFGSHSQKVEIKIKINHEGLILYIVFIKKNPKNY